MWWFNLIKLVLYSPIFFLFEKYKPLQRVYLFERIFSGKYKMFICTLQRVFHIGAIFGFSKLIIEVFPLNWFLELKFSIIVHDTQPEIPRSWLGPTAHMGLLFLYTHLSRSYMSEIKMIIFVQIIYSWKLIIIHS